jgi:hypothetical protein
VRRVGLRKDRRWGLFWRKRWEAGIAAKARQFANDASGRDHDPETACMFRKPPEPRLTQRKLFVHADLLDAVIGPGCRI